MHEEKPLDLQLELYRCFMFRGITFQKCDLRAVKDIMQEEITEEYFTQ